MVSISLWFSWASNGRKCLKILAATCYLPSVYELSCLSPAKKCLFFVIGWFTNKKSPTNFDTRLTSINTSLPFGWAFFHVSPHRTTHSGGATVAGDLRRKIRSSNVVMSRKYTDSPRTTSIHAMNTTYYIYYTVNLHKYAICYFLMVLCLPTKQEEKFSQPFKLGQLPSQP